MMHGQPMMMRQQMPPTFQQHPQGMIQPTGGKVLLEIAAFSKLLALLVAQSQKTPVLVYTPIQIYVKSLQFEFFFEKCPM